MLSLGFGNEELALGWIWNKVRLKAMEIRGSAKASGVR